MFVTGLYDPHANRTHFVGLLILSSESDRAAASSSVVDGNSSVIIISGSETGNFIYFMFLLVFVAYNSVMLWIVRSFLNALFKQTKVCKVMICKCCLLFSSWLLSQIWTEMWLKGLYICLRTSYPLYKLVFILTIF